jgi:hypothetical protein
MAVGPFGGPALVEPGVEVSEVQAFDWTRRLFALGTRRVLTHHARGLAADLHRGRRAQRQAG